MTDDKQKRLVRFDFPPGAGPDEIAAAIEAMRAKYRQEKKVSEEARTHDPRRHADDAETEA